MKANEIIKTIKEIRSVKEGLKIFEEELITITEIGYVLEKLKLNKGELGDTYYVEQVEEEEFPQGDLASDYLIYRLLQETIK